MSLAAPSISRRRQFLLGALTVALHLIVFRFISGQVGRVAGEPGQDRGPLVVAQLVEMQAPPPPSPAPPPRLVLAPPPLPELAPEPVKVAEAPATPAQDAPATGATPAPAPASQVADATPAAGQDGADSHAQQAAPPNVSADPAPPQPAQPAQPAQLEGRRYKVDLPPPAEITLSVARTDADGTRWTGEEMLSWTLGPDGYRIRVEAGLRVVFARVNLLTVTSEGKLGDEGFIPTLMTEKRRGRAMTATHFNWDDKRLTFSASSASYPLVPYAQDKASVPLQLAAIARADPGQLSGKIEFLVGEDRDASVFSFTVAGQEEIATPLGRIATWHFVRPPKPGSYSSRLELWLAPGYGWYPVQIRNVEASGATTTQTVSNIVIKKEAGS